MLNNLFFIDDIVELWIKLNQRGLKFILSKFNFVQYARTISSFDDQFKHANWWVIPFIKQRHNFQITGDARIDYEQYISEKYMQHKKFEATLISLGCGEGSHELKLAKLNPNLTILSYDFSEKLINKAKKKALDDNVLNITFSVSDVYTLKLENESVDYFLFNASLHHFKEISAFITIKIKPALKKGGLVIINEYVGPNRLNFPKEQIAYCDKCLNTVVSERNRKILNLNKIKNRCYRLGKLRMIISDPSECVDSESILPVLKRELKELELKQLGGNILLPVLKHIAHHFAHSNEQELLELIKKEDEYLITHASDFIFAIYQKE